MLRWKTLAPRPPIKREKPMSEPTCQLSRVRPESVTRTGIGITDLSGTRENLFTEIANPPSMLARLSSLATAYEDWRGTLTLDPIYRAYALGWPLEIELQPGVRLDQDAGIPSWEAERAVAGLLEGEAYYIERAAGLLLEAKGCLLELPGEVSAVLVRLEDFSRCVKVGNPILLFGGEEQGLDLVPTDK